MFRMTGAGISTGPAVQPARAARAEADQAGAIVRAEMAAGGGGGGGGKRLSRQALTRLNLQ
jgi:hypothetical protein